MIKATRTFYDTVSTCNMVVAKDYYAADIAFEIILYAVFRFTHAFAQAERGDTA